MRIASLAQNSSGRYPIEWLRAYVMEGRVVTRTDAVQYSRRPGRHDQSIHSE